MKHSAEIRVSLEPNIIAREIDGLVMRQWFLSFFGRKNAFFVQQYSVQTKKTPRHKWVIVEKWSFNEKRDNTIPTPPALPHDLAKLALEEFFKSVRIVEAES